MPSPPRAAREPANSASPRRTVRSSPSAPTSSMADTAVARAPFPFPEPWVPVEQAPAMEMWGWRARRRVHAWVLFSVLLDEDLVFEGEDEFGGAKVEPLYGNIGPGALDRVGEVEP